MEVRQPLRRARASIERGPARLRADWWPLAQIVLAAALAWQLSDLVPNHQAGIFAPIIAAVALGAGPGQRGSMAVQFIVGVGLGILVGDLVAWLFGGGSWQLALATAAGLVGATLLGLGEFVALQTGISALIVVALHPAQLQLVPDRMIDAAVGAAVALLFSQVLFPADPVELVAGRTRPALDELADGLTRLAEALTSGDEDEARQAMHALQHVDERGVRDALSGARAIVRRAPRRRRGAGRLRAYERVAEQLDTAGRDAAVLATGAVRLLRTDARAAEAVADPVRRLGDSVRGLSDSLDGTGAGLPDRAAVRAVAEARQALADRGDLGAELVLAQIAALAGDVLRACGAPDDRAAEFVARAREGEVSATGEEE